ncbi:ABC-2 type transport system ATP-binding protein [Jatrophihabitans sp. GAS493]|uniref:ATP-binding cassette domain-containing protein n=1 Tax=Jatrophihabitans sp. GAS493 TaxID=1907575 RepID=UPI000BB6F19A|nr:ATP-binding cassette domain-containing protein [Jatrophihabitans sp. GAS493]SOD75168.1 ABC-2 type transport system ATP-binding protein [Jatrophihabitans sp. GAS493]
MSDAVIAEGLVKHFGRTVALDGLDLAVPEGTVLGLLGPNGAGKTTAVRVLATLLRPDAGRAVVRGIDVTTHPEQVRRIIGVTGQFAAIDDYLTGRENLILFGRLFHLGRARSAARADELLERFDLTDAASRIAKTYSGGMRRRLDIAASLISQPQVLFLDEPTTGLDPRSRLGMWTVIEDLVREGTTMLLTTQYLEEADALASSIAVIDAGKVIARGTSDELKSQVGGARLELAIAAVGTSAVDSAAVDSAAANSAAANPTAANSSALDTAAAIMRGVGDGADPSVDAESRRLSVPITGGASVLAEVVRQLDAVGIVIEDLALRRPTLDDVFLSLTGHAATDETGADAPTAGAQPKQPVKGRHS